MNIQERTQRFNETIDLLNEQGERSLAQDSGGRPLGVCAYQSGNKRCAVGLWIPKDHPSLGFMGDLLDLLREYPDLEESLRIPEDGPEQRPTQILYQRLQYLHDSSSNWFGGKLRADAVDNTRNKLRNEGIIE